MRKMKNTIVASVICLLIIFSCQTADQLVPTNGNEITALSIILPDGKKIDADLQISADNNINIEVEGDLSTDMSKIRMFVNVPNNAKVEAEVPMGTYMDFTKPIKIDVVSSIGERKTYTITATLVRTGIKTQELWRKTGSLIDFTKDNNRSVAISGDYIVVHDRAAQGAFPYYRLETGEKVGVLSNEGVNMDALHMISDDAGNIVSSSFTPAAGNEFRVYWWDGVEAKPEILFSWISDAPGNIGRKLFVRGDMNTLAYLYATVSSSNMFLRWEIKGGEVTSNAPDKVQFVHPNEGWGVTGKVLPITVGKNSNYFINTSSQARITYMSGETNEALYNSESHIENVFDQWLSAPWGSAHAFDYVDIKGARYIFMIEQNSSNWMSSIFSVRNMMKNPSSVKNVSSLVHTRVYNSWLDFPLDPVFGSNANIVGEVKAQVSEDGDSAIVAFLSTNGGIKVWRVSLL